MPNEPVKRYTPDQAYIAEMDLEKVEMIDDPIGNYVHFADYDRLASELAAYKQAVVEFGNDAGCAQTWIDERVAELLRDPTFGA